MAPSPTPKIIRLTNCRLALPHSSTLVQQDLYLDCTTGKIVDPQDAFFSHHSSPTQTIDLNNRIVAPGLIDVQINGCFGLDFSAPSPTYAADLSRVKKSLLKTGVTSFLPTLTSQYPEVYHSTLSHLRADSKTGARDPHAGTESLGAHCEGPFISPSKCGIHAPSCLRPCSSITDLESCYGAENLDPDTIRLVTLAPELDASGAITRSLTQKGIIHSIGHSAATHEQALQSVEERGSSMITHLYNAMPQPHHRDTGIVGLLGGAAKESRGSGKDQRPYFGIIADSIHVHPSMVSLAYAAHPEGCILVTDAMSVLGLPDGTYPWTNGEVFEKRGEAVILERTGGIAGSAISLVSCLNNLVRWTGVNLAVALRTVTRNPARMLGVERSKGVLEVGADADLVVLSEQKDGVKVEEVWKFGERAFVRKKGDEGGKVIKARL